MKFRSGAENVARGQRKAARVHKGWMNSPGHRRNILQPGYTRIGVGYVACPENRGPYWTQNFAGDATQATRDSYDVESTGSSRRSSGQSCGAREPAPPPHAKPLGFRLLAESGGWLLGGGLGMVGGGLGGAKYAEANPGADRGAWMILAGAGGGLLGGPLGSFLAGEGVSGHGEFVPTILSGLAAGGAGVLLAYPFEGSVEEFAIVGGMSLAGSVIGYEISHLIKWKQFLKSSNLQVAPSVGVSGRDGAAVFGVFGRF